MDIRQIPAGEFKTHCLRLMDEVSGSGAALLVTKHGKPVVKIMPVKATKKSKRPKAGFMKGSILYQGDIVSPLHEVWGLDSWNFPS